MFNTLAALTLIVALVWHAQAQQPVFRSSIELVTLDVSVVDGAGKPIEGLGPEDFELSVDGARRRVVSAQFVTYRRSTDMPVRSAHFSTNEDVTPGRLVLVAVDQMHIRRVEGRAALQAAAAFIDSLELDDRVAAVPLTHAGGIQFTTEHVTVKRHLERLSGTASQAQVFYNIGLTEALSISEGSRISLEQVVRRECGESLGGATDQRRIAKAEGVKDPCPAQVELEGRSLAQQARTDARMSLNALRTLIARLADIEGPKTIVLLSEGLVAEPQYFDLSALGAAAHAARVTIYVLQLDAPMLDASDARMSPTALADIHVRGDGLARLAGSARGALFRLVGSDPYPFRRIVSELSGHYLLAFEPVGRDRDSGNHRLEVKVRTRGAIVRARPSFRNSGAQARDTTETELVRLLRDPRPSIGLPLRVSTYGYRQPDGAGLKIVAAAETSVREDVTVGFIIVSRSGVIAANGAGIAPQGRYVATAAIPEGSYMLKVAVIDSTGRSGSVERHFDARLGNVAGVPVGDLMLAEPVVGGGTALQPVVASLRGDQLIAYLEVYAPDDWSPRAGAVTVEVMAGEGDVPARIPAVVERVGPGRWTATARWPLDNLPAGARLAVMTVALPGAEPLRLSRPFAVERRR